MDGGDFLFQTDLQLAVVCGAVAVATDFSSVTISFLFVFVDFVLFNDNNGFINNKKFVFIFVFVFIDVVVIVVIVVGCFAVPLAFPLSFLAPFLILR